jgi:hypothetical protein
LAVVLLAVLLLGGGSAAHKGTSTAAASSHARARHTAAAHARHSSPAGRANVNVVVLNGTETNGLAHRVSGQLQQSGYTRATAQSGRPPGANQVTVVEYAPGHKGDAEAVAHTIGVTQAQPLEETVSTLAGSANVVVIVGLDKAAAGT